MNELVTVYDGTGFPHTALRRTCPVCGQAFANSFYDAIDINTLHDALVVSEQVRQRDLRERIDATGIPCSQACRAAKSGQQ